MRQYFLLFFTLCLGACADAPKSTIVNKPILIDSAYSINEDCSTMGVGSILIITPPTNGTYQIVEGKAKPNFAKTNPRFVCNITDVPATNLIYKPNEGFKGTDSIHYRIIFSSGNDREVTRVLNVY